MNASTDKTATNPPAAEQELEQWPDDLIAFKWADTLSEGEQSTLLTGSIKRLQERINIATRAHPTLAAENARLRDTVTLTIEEFDSKRLERCTYCRKGYEWNDAERQHIFHCATPKFDGQLLPCVADELRVMAERLRAALGESK
jgi:hypothetical protein